MVDKPGFDAAHMSGRSRPIRAGYLVAGCLMLAFGFIGALLPLMPMTIFLILAAGCFARSSPRTEAWLLGHLRFGATLRAWRKDGAIPARGKLIALAGMFGGYVVFFIWVMPGPRLAIPAGILILACATYVLSRPTMENRRIPERIRDHLKEIPLVSDPQD